MSYLPPLGGRSYEDVVIGIRRVLYEGMIDGFTGRPRRPRRVGTGDVYRSYESSVEDAEDRTRTVTSRVGSSALDRFRTVIHSDGIDLSEFKRNPVVLYAHGTDPRRGEMPIGQCVSIKPVLGPDGFELIARTMFDSDDFSRECYEKVKRGVLRGWSVRVIPRTVDTSPPTRDEIRARPELRDCLMCYRRSTLAEYSLTSVPGNQTCLTIDTTRSARR